MTSTRLLPKSEVVNVARLALLVEVLLAPYLMWMVPSGETWEAILVAAGNLTLVFLLYKFSGQLTPRRHFLLTVGAMLLLFSALMLTGGVQSRLTPLYFILVIAAADLSGYAYGIATAAMALGLELVVLYLGSRYNPTPHALEMIYVQLAILSIAVLAGMYVWSRKQMLLAQARSVYDLATALHREDTPNSVLRALGTSLASAMAADAVVLYKGGRSDGKDADPRVIVSEGRWSKSLHEAFSPGTVNHRLVVDGDTYHLAIRRPKNYSQDVWSATTLHFALALRRALNQVTTYTELKRWFDLANRAQVETLEVLVAMLETRDPFTGGHSRRVSAYATHLAKRLGQPPDVVEEVRKASILHDVGKIGLPDGILLKPGPLTPDEWREVRKHPVIGEDLVSKVSGLQSLRPMVRGHHERWDGLGYPDGLAGDEIALTTRILAVADGFDAITTTRSYKAAKTPTQACAILREGAGSQWCPTCVDAMLGIVLDGSLPTREIGTVTPRSSFLAAGSK